MRLFTGISLPEATLYKLESLLAPLRPLAQIRWSPSSNLHITTRFIGDWSPEKLPELLAGLAAIESPPFEIQLSGVGWFPNLRSPHVFWMGVRADDSLARLAASTDFVLSKLGHPKEDRPFHPHLTLARTRHEAKLTPLHRALEALPSVEFPPFTVADFHLYQSDGGVYRKLHTFELLATGPRKIY